MKRDRLSSHDQDGPIADIQPLPGSSSTRRRLTRSAVIAAGMLPLAPASAMAQDYAPPSQPGVRPNPFALVGGVINLLKANDADPNATYVEPKLAVGIGNQECSIDRLNTAKVLKMRRKSNGSLVVELAFRRTDAMVTLDLGGSGTTPGQSGTLEFGCGTFNPETDTVTPIRRRVVRSTNTAKGKVKYVAVGSSKKIKPYDDYSVMPKGTKGDDYEQKVTLTYRNTTSNDVKKGNVRFRMTRQWGDKNVGPNTGKLSEVYGPLKRKGQVIDPDRTPPKTVQSSSSASTGDGTYVGLE